jgi:hypothetical protein
MQTQVPALQLPLGGLQDAGHSAAMLQERPLQPAAHWHTPPLQEPCAEQSSTHSSSSSSELSSLAVLSAKK